MDDYRSTKENKYTSFTTYGKNNGINMEKTFGKQYQLDKYSS